MIDDKKLSESPDNKKFLESINHHTNYDFVLTLGGDGNFLSATNYIKNGKLLLIGVNTDPLRSSGNLCNFKIPPDAGVGDLEEMILKLKNIKQ